MDFREIKIGTLLGVGMVAIIVLLIVPTVYSNSLSTRAQNIITDSTENIFEAMTIQRDVDELFSAADHLVFALEEREVLEVKTQLDQLVERLQADVDHGRQQDAFVQHEIEQIEVHVAALTDVSANIIRLKELSRQRGPEEAGLFPELDRLRAARYGLLAVVTEVIRRSDGEFRSATQLVRNSQLISWAVMSFSLIVAVTMAFLLVRYVRKIYDLKNEFVNIIAHDLRNPITAIIGYLDIIATGHNLELADIKKYLRIVDVSAQRLRNKINNLLEVGRSEAGYTKINLETVHVGEVLMQSVKRAEAFAETKGVRIRYEQPVGSEVAVLADEIKLADVFDNLLSNAIKYNGKEGLVTVSTKDEGTTLSVSVADTGSGIPEDQQDRMFKKYSRLRTSGSKKVGGTGLGLYTVKLAMDQMKGSVGFTTTQGHGTTFTVTFQKRLAS